jgi:hypothetical protein
MANEAVPTAKPWWQSKTVWMNVLALLSMAVPAVREWVAKNPVEPVAAFAALSVLIRFVTSGKISIFGDDGDDSSGAGNTTSSGTGVSGGNSTGRQTDGSAKANGKTRRSGIPWLVAPACVLVLLTGCVVGVDANGGWSVRPDPQTVDAGLAYLVRHQDDAKSGLRRTNRGDAKAAEVNAEK